MLWLIKLCLLTSSVFAATESDKGATLNYLRAVLKQNYTRLAELDQATQKALSLAKIDKEEEFSPLQNQIQKDLEFEINKWAVERKELLLRQDFLDRLIFRVDSHFRGGDLQQFLTVQLKEMTFLEATSADSSNTKLWKFLSYLTTAVTEMPERNEDMASFIEGYMNFSSIQEPKSPKEFMKTREYTNGKTSVAAQSISRDDIGEVVEQRLKQMKIDTFKLRTNSR